MVLGGQVHAASIGGFFNPLHRCYRLAVRTFQRHPLLVKTVTSGIGFAAGDALTQLGTRKPGAKYDFPRTAKMAVAGWVIAGPLGYVFLMWMEKNIMPQAAASRLAVTTKVTLDQVLGCALWHAALLSINEPYRQAALGLVERVKEAMPPGRSKQHLL